MFWNLKNATGICWEQQRKPCGQVERLEGRDVSCMRCMVVSDFIDDPCDIKLDYKADESLEEYLAFLLRVNAITRKD